MHTINAMFTPASTAFSVQDLVFWSGDNQELDEQDVDLLDAPEDTTSVTVPTERVAKKRGPSMYVTLVEGR